MILLTHKEAMMSEAIINDPTKRHDFLLLFDVADGNPNGDPDAGNMPRIDPETGNGLVTDVCLKRKIRNYVEIAKGGAPGYEIFIREKGILNRQIEQAYQQLAIDLQVDPADPADGKKRREKGKAQGSEMERGRELLCRNKYDVRMFGAVMMTGANAGQVRGPLQLTFARSISPVTPLDISITRMAVATEEEAEKQGGDNRTMGRKAILPYGLYLAKGFFSSAFAKQTGVTTEDLELFWQALQYMWDFDHSASRGLMACRGLYVFTHENGLGNAPTHTLFDRFEAKPRKGSDATRSYGDYVVYLNDRNLPDGVTLTKLVGGD
jgi:CRISPR-associated protein Csd2